MWPSPTWRRLPARRQQIVSMQACCSWFQKARKPSQQLLPDQQLWADTSEPMELSHPVTGLHQLVSEGMEAVTAAAPK